MQSRLSSTTTFGAVQLPNHLPSVYDAAIRSLIAERELFATVAPLLSDIGKAEAEPIGVLPDMPALLSSWASVINTLQSWRMQREAPRGMFSLNPFPSKLIPSRLGPSRQLRSFILASATPFLLDR